MASTKSPDEIMAEYLLKGGKMLAKTCPVCRSPLFEYKGETLCVVCLEDEMAQEPERTVAKKTVAASRPPAQAPAISPAVLSTGTLEEEFSQTLSSLLVQAREERDSTRVLHLMDAVKRGAEAYALLLYGYDRLESS